MMKKLLLVISAVVFVSCNSGNYNNSKKIITVSVAPFEYFVKAIAGDDFDVNVMVPASADPHIYEPTPGQVTSLSKSVAYFSDGYLGFEMTWLNRFYGANPSMKKISLGENIELIKEEEHHHEGHVEGADPHYWSSPKEAMKIAASVFDALSELNPGRRDFYQERYNALRDTIASVDSLAATLFSGQEGSAFMIFHPALGYLARDYGLIQLAVENEGKEPTPSSLKALIDTAAVRKIKVIFIQAGFDTKNAGAIALETGATLVPVDPLSADWPGSMRAIIKEIYKSITLGRR